MLFISIPSSFPQFTRFSRLLGINFSLQIYPHGGPRRPDVPPVHRNVAFEYADFNFWRSPMQEFELLDLAPEQPASPASSARSDMLRLSRLRNFRLVSRRNSTSRTAEKDKDKTSPSAAASGSGSGSSRNGEVPRQGRQSSPLASPVLRPEDAVDADDDYDSEPHGYRQDRRLSMPGSIDGKTLGAAIQ